MKMSSKREYHKKVFISIGDKCKCKGNFVSAQTMKAYGEVEVFISFMRLPYPWERDPQPIE
jgi:hypothetical protein